MNTLNDNQISAINWTIFITNIILYYLKIELNQVELNETNRDYSIIPV